jgi:hypothetical protein
MSLYCNNELSDYVQMAALRFPNAFCITLWFQCLCNQQYRRHFSEKWVIYPSLSLNMQCGENVLDKIYRC